MTRRGCPCQRPEPLRLAALALTCALLALGSTAAAQTDVPINWPLKPSGLNVGDEFRLLFGTSSTRSGLDVNINTPHPPPLFREK